MKHVIIFLTFLTIIIVNVVSFHIGNSSGMNFNTLLEMFEANAEDVDCWDCSFSSKVEIGDQCPPEDPLPQESFFEYDRWCWEDPSGYLDFDGTCYQKGFIDCCGETFYLINTGNCAES